MKKHIIKLLPLILTIALLLVFNAERVYATLSAITADLGTVTAGTISGLTINGSTINAGTSNSVVLNSSGITLTAGGNNYNQVKWSNGTYVTGNGGNLDMGTSTNVTATAGGHLLQWGSGQLTTYNGDTLGNASFRWGHTFLGGDINWNNAPTTTADDYPLVHSNNNVVYRKTNGYSGTCSSPSSIVIERGIVVGCS